MNPFPTDAVVSMLNRISFTFSAFKLNYLFSPFTYPVYFHLRVSDPEEYGNAFLYGQFSFHCSLIDTICAHRSGRNTFLLCTHSPSYFARERFFCLLKAKARTMFIDAREIWRDLVSLFFFFHITIPLSLFLFLSLSLCIFVFLSPQS